MGGQEQQHGRWTQDKTGDLSHIPAPPPSVTIGGSLLWSACLFSVAFGLCFLPWFEDFGMELGTGVAFANGFNKSDPRWKTAALGFAVVYMAAMLATVAITRSLPAPFNEFLPMGLGGMVGSVAYAAIIGWRRAT